MKFTILITMLLLAGCASTKKVVYTIQSNPPDAVIDVNGVTLCDQTPCKVELSCSTISPIVTGKQHCN